MEAAQEYLCLIYVDSQKRKEFNLDSLKQLATKYSLEAGEKASPDLDKAIYDSATDIVYQPELMNYREFIYRECFGEEEANESWVSLSELSLSRFSFKTNNLNSGSEFAKEAMGLEHVVFISLRKKIR